MALTIKTMIKGRDLWSAWWWLLLVGLVVYSGYIREIFWRGWFIGTFAVTVSFSVGFRRVLVGSVLAFLAAWAVRTALPDNMIREGVATWVGPFFCVLASALHTPGFLFRSRNDPAAGNDSRIGTRRPNKKK
jgi:hypothetical protein